MTDTTQSSTGAQGGAEGVVDSCRPVTIPVDGEDVTIRVHSAAEPSAEAAQVIAEAVRAVCDNLAGVPLTARRLGLAVLRQHFPTGDSCGCGRYGTDRQLWSWHVWSELRQARVLATPGDPATTAAELVEQRQAQALAGHFPAVGRCGCGSALGANATLWSGHALNRLATAGATVPLDDPLASS